MKKIWIILISVIVSGGLVGGGTYYFQNEIAKNEKKNLQVQIDDLNAKIATAEKSLADLKAADANTNVDDPTSSVAFPDEAAPTFIKDASGYHGILTLTGYINQQQVAANSFEGATTEEVNYVSFIFTKSNSDLISSFLSENAGNSFTSEQSVGIGCYDIANSKIYSSNDADSGTIENNITGRDLVALLASTASNPVKLQLTKPIYTSGRGAPACYSHFREFKIVK